jgi:hypothetical protein
LRFLTAGTLLVGLIAACGSNGGSGQSDASASSIPANPSSSSSQQTAASSAGSLHGIILGIDGDTSVKLEALDPGTGQVTAVRGFPTAQAAEEPLNLRGRGADARQAFNSDFTELSATGPQQSDGSQAAGYLDTTGQFHALTASPSGFANPVTNTALAFNPVTGRLWYQSSDGNTTWYESVDPSAGASSAQHETLKQASNVDYENPAYFAQDGWGPVPILDGGVLYMAGGLELDYWSDASGSWLVEGRYGQYNLNDPPLNIQPADITPTLLLPVSKTSFIIIGTGNDYSATLYTCTLSGHNVRCHPLVPVTNNQFGDVVLNPAHTELAFTATVGQEESLFTVKLGADGPYQPTKILTFDPGQLAGGYWLLDWLS